MSQPTPTSNYPEADEFGAICIKKFYYIPKTGKPTNDQWTVLSSIIQYDSNSGISRVVAQGTGTKCIGHSQLCPDGIVLNDSHAEVMVRRAFLRYIYTQFFKNESIFLIDKVTSRFRLKEGITFHFFSTHLPCGDASILDDPVFEKNMDDFSEYIKQENIKLENIKLEPGMVKIEPGTIKSEYGKIKQEPGCVKVEQLTVKIEPGIIKQETETPESINRPIVPQCDEDDDSPPEKRQKIFYNQIPSDIGPELPIIYTGAKILGLDVPDLMEQRIGCMRIKPGRGVRTLSMSCSDKISRWNILGIQGALLDSLLCDPIYLKTYNFCGQFKEAAVRRAIYKRWSDIDFRHYRYTLQKPIVRGCSSDISFKYAHSDAKKPSPTSLAWVNSPYVNLEIAVCGYKQGLTKKALNSKLGGLHISKAALFAEYVRVIKKYPNVIKPLTPEKVESMTYLEAKNIAADYQRAWEVIKLKIFCKWTKKPRFLLDFKLANKKFVTYCKSLNY